MFRNRSLAGSQEAEADLEKIEPLAFEHADLLEENLRRSEENLSEYRFSNLYLFRSLHEYRVVYTCSGRIFISGKTYDKCSFLMPLFDIAQAGRDLISRLLQRYDFIFPISEERLKAFDPGYFSAWYNPDDSDYIYSAEKLKSYRGEKLGKKKNLMKQFAGSFRADSYPYGPERRKDAENILKQWQDDTGKPFSSTDYCQTIEALKLAGPLNLFGNVYYASDEPAGFLLAGEICPGMCVIHFAKGKRKFKGIYPYMFNHFARNNGDRFSFYNFEQDLGKANFRKTKKSYDPDFLLKKYRVALKA